MSTKQERAAEMLALENRNPVDKDEVARMQKRHEKEEEQERQDKADDSPR